ncbi:MAG: hypothetical protein ACI3U8_06125 [Candidatus Onthomonas sp.]
MKKLSALLLCLLLLCSLFAPAAALDTGADQAVSTQTIDLGDGWTVTEELIINDQARTASRAATKKQSFSKNGEAIADIAITGVFRYDGSTVSVSSKVVSQKDTYNGWSFSQSSFTSSGGTITLTGKLTKPLNASGNVNITLTCDKNGNIS